MTTTHHFVDEAGEATSFGRYGKRLAGTDAVSRFSIVGRLEVADRAALEADLSALRAELLADPRLNTALSMLPAAGKTAVFFHARDDVPEVRHAVFRPLLRHELQFFRGGEGQTRAVAESAATHGRPRRPALPGRWR